MFKSSADLTVGTSISQDDDLFWEVFVVLVEGFDCLGDHKPGLSSDLIGILLKTGARVELGVVAGHGCAEGNHCSVLNLVGGSVDSDNHCLVS